MRASLASKVILTGIPGKFVQVPAKVKLTGKSKSWDKGDIDRKKS
jgi:hypothetical protein